MAPISLKGQDTFQDNFSSISYSNNNGNMNFVAALTATATLANSTSELSPMCVIKLPLVITNRRITYRANP